MMSPYTKRHATALATAVFVISNFHSEQFELPPIELDRGTSYTARNSQLGVGFESDEAQLQILTSFAKDLIENSTHLEPEIAKIVNDNFWDLYDRF